MRSYEVKVWAFAAPPHQLRQGIHQPLASIDDPSAQTYSVDHPGAFAGSQRLWLTNKLQATVIAQHLQAAHSQGIRDAQAAVKDALGISR